jgi:hypothetical protein
MANLRVYEGSPIDRMMSGSIYRTFKGLKASDEVGLFTPKQKFIPHRFSKWLPAGPAVALSPYLYNTMGFGPLPVPPDVHFRIGVDGALCVLQPWH